MPLPEHVFRIIKPSGRVYYYHQKGRRRPKGERGALTRIAHDPDQPEFWAAAARLNGAGIGRAPPDALAAPARGSFRALLHAYKASPRWRGHADGTRETYSTYLSLIERAWGDLQADDLTIAGIVTLRDEVAEKAPSAANMLLKVLRALLKWGINTGHCTRNAARDIEAVDTEVEHALPWPVEIWRKAVDEGPADISRFAFLARVTGQRVSDVVRMRPAYIRGDLMQVRIKKLRGAVHLVPMAPEDLAVIRSWKTVDLEPFIIRPGGRPHDAESLRRRLTGWVAGLGITGAEEIKPHGLRAMACCDARLKGVDPADIAALYRLSVGQVKTYTHHIDREAEARNALEKRGAVQTVRKLREATP